jgi:hypothetical protein
MKSHVWAMILLLLGSTVAFSETPEPCLSTLGELVDARLLLLKPKHEVEVKKFETVKNNNDWLDKLILDRITGSYSVGKGLTVDDSTDGSPSRTLLATDRSTSAWTITYSAPLSLFRQKISTDDGADDEIDILESKQQFERQEEAIKINLMHNDFLEARRNFLACGDPSKPECLAHGYKMRKLAINLLLLTGIEGCLNEWSCFLEKEDCPSLYQMMLNVQGTEPKVNG